MIGRVRRSRPWGRWVFEVCPEYPVGETWESQMASSRKGPVIAYATKCLLNGLVKEWHEENDG